MRMKKTLFILATLLIVTPVFSAPPARLYTYSSGETISSSEVTSNEDQIFNYLQAGVDTISDGTIVNADISASANIQASKLNLTSISQNIVNVGTFSNTGNTTITGTLLVTSVVAVGSGGSHKKVVCWNNTNLGYCSDQPGADGSCTCN